MESLNSTYPTVAGINGIQLIKELATSSSDGIRHTHELLVIANMDPQVL